MSTAGEEEVGGSQIQAVEEIGENGQGVEPGVALVGTAAAGLDGEVLGQVEQAGADALFEFVDGQEHWLIPCREACGL